MIEHLRRLGRRIVEGRAGPSDGRARRVVTDGGRRDREGGIEGATGRRTDERNVERERGLSDRIWGMLSAPFQEPAPEPVSPTERPDDTFLDHDGSFCEQTFERETGYSVSGFVVEFVGEHGGAVRQQAIVRCLPWSDSKVSRLLGDMEREGRLVRRSIGRENAVFLPDAVPDEP